jgi:GNAT superfamily N-acetyltransferase
MNVTFPISWHSGKNSWSCCVARTATTGKSGLVGFSLAQIETLPEWFGAEQIGLIRYLAVSENYRGGGVGHEMVTFVIDWFRSLGISRAELHVLKGLPASGFWSKIGFKAFMDRRFREI